MRVDEDVHLAIHNHTHQVYLMRNILSQKRVCIKVIKIKKMTTEERTKCFREVEVMGKFSHPAIVG